MCISRSLSVGLGVSVVFLMTVTVNAAPVGTSFTYQGKLTDTSVPANGVYDFELALYDAASAGLQVGATITLEDVPVANGVFVVALDFGSGAFTGDARWLQIGVRPGAETGTFTTLSSRQELTPTPNAIHVPWSGVTGKPAGFADDIDDDSGGDITGVTAGSGLTGGGTTGDVTLSLDTTYSDGRYVLQAGDTMTGTLNLPSNGLAVGTKQLAISGGRVGIGTASPGETLHVEGGNVLMRASGESELRMLRQDLVNAPAFRLGRIVIAGDGSPEFRVLYSDDATPERSVFEFDNKGIVASVKPTVGSHFEGFIAGDSQPLFRLNSYPQMRLELGAGGATAPDVALLRPSAGGMSIETGGAERLHVNAAGNVGVGTTTPTQRLEVAGSVRITDGSEGSGKVLKSDSDGVASWQTDNDSGGDITGVTAGAGLTGGGMTGDVTLGLDTSTTDGRYALKSGDTVTGSLTFSNDAQIMALRAENATGDPAAAAAGNAGRVYYNTTTNQPMYSNGSTWVPMGHRYAWSMNSASTSSPSCSGLVSGRDLVFTKARDDTRLRITYSDTFRVSGTSAAAVWEIKLDAASLAVPLKAAFYSDSGTHEVRSTLIGWALGVSAGTHSLAVMVSPLFGVGACYNGEPSFLSVSLLEAEELP